MRILICGDRNWQDTDSIESVILQVYGFFEVPDNYSIIHGAATGADSIAGKVALENEIVSVSVPAQWRKYGKSAGPKRNEFMLNRCKPDWVIAFHHDIASSKGTKHMVGIAKLAGVPTTIIKNADEAGNILNVIPESLR